MSLGFHTLATVFNNPRYMRFPTACSICSISWTTLLPGRSCHWHCDGLGHSQLRFWKFFVRRASGHPSPGGEDGLTNLPASPTRPFAELFLRSTHVPVK